MAILGNKISKIGKNAMVFGTILMATGIGITSYVFYHYNLGVHSWQLIPGLIIMGIGMGFVFGSLFGIVLNGVDPSHAGSASGTLNAVQQLGGSIGVAVVGVIFFGQLSHASAASFNKVEYNISSNLTSLHIPPKAQTAIIADTKTCFVDRSTEKDSSITPPSCYHLSSPKTVGNVKVYNAISDSALQANANNFANAFRWSSIYMVLLLLLTTIMTLFLPKKLLSKQKA
jgi:hypothetical protein